MTNTPTVDRLAEEGTRFNQAISGASWTPPCMSSIFSGIYPHRLGMYDFDVSYPDGVTSLFGQFEAEGYEVGSFVFDENYLFNNVPEANVIDNFRDYSKPLRWIEKHSEDDFFLFIHHYWVHGPYEPQDSAESWSEENERIKQELRNNHEEAVKKYRRKYTEAVEEMSENWLHGILDTLKSKEILDETLIVFTGDHGESWGERYENKSEITTNFHMHGKLLYDELIRVPLILRYPGEIPKGVEVDDQVRHVDIFPTLMELEDVTVDDQEWQRDGTSLLPLLDNGESETRSAISSATDVELEQVDKMSIRYPDEKLIWTLSRDDIELYDLESDPDESTNVAPRRSERAMELRSVLEAEIEKIPSDKGSTDEIKQRLEDLGYL